MNHIHAETLRQASPAALDLSTGSYLRLLHPVGSIGRVNFMIADRRDRPILKVTDVDQAPFYGECAVERTAFVSLNRFHGPREDKRLAALNAVFVDLDVDRVPRRLAADPAAWCDAVYDLCRANQLPEPTFLNSTGRGLAAIWLIDPLPPQARKRWRAALKAVIQLFRPLGADPKCSDTPRIFRIPGSINPKSGRPVRVLSGSLRRIPLQILEDPAYIALGRPSRDQFLVRKARRKTDVEGRARGPGLPPAARFSQIRQDLEAICANWGGSVPVGKRNIYLHLWATCLTHSDDEEDIMGRVERMAALVAPALPLSEVRSIGRCAEDHAALPRNQNPTEDGRYHYSGAHIAALLDVDDALAVQLGLRQVLSGAERKRRKARKEASRRRAAGAVSREVYLTTHTTSRDKPWIQEGVSRTTWYRRRRSESAA